VYCAALSLWHWQCKVANEHEQRVHFCSCTCGTIAFSIGVDILCCAKAFHCVHCLLLDAVLDCCRYYERSPLAVYCYAPDSSIYTSICRSPYTHSFGTCTHTLLLLLYTHAQCTMQERTSNLLMSSLASTSPAATISTTAAAAAAVTTTATTADVIATTITVNM
jgi:hypothetical protein